MSRISQLLAGRTKEHKLLVPFFTAGYPKATGWIDLIRAADDSGADIVEIGMPFSDPLADGPSIQFSSFTALRSGINLDGILRGVEQIRRTSATPLVLMGYVNPLLAYGLDRFLADAAAAGVDGLIIPDLPVDEAGDYRALAARHGLSAIFLVAPTSVPERVNLIDKSSTDFVYAVTVTGVTGSGKVFGADTDRYLKRLKKVLDKPFVAGFGVSSPEAACRLAQQADGVVIGSALVEMIRSSSDHRDGIDRVRKFLKTVRKVLP